MYSIIACRTRHDLSSASSTTAGSRLSDKSSIPITRGNDYQGAGAPPLCEAKPTFIDLIEFADNIQTNLRELVFEEVEEKRQEVFDGGLLPQERCEATDLCGESRPDVLRRILTQVSHTWNDPEENHLFLEQFRETWTLISVSTTNDYESPTGNLTRGSSTNFSFIVLQKLNVMSNQFLADEVLPNGLRQLMRKFF